MIKARACIVMSLVTIVLLGSHLSHAARRGPGFPIGDLETVMAKRGAVTDGFLLTAWLPKATFAPGEDIQLWLTLQNVSHQVLRFQRRLPELDFPLVVQDAAGRILLPKTDDLPTGFLAIELQPGDGVVRDYPLKRMYDLPGPGTYHITATASVLPLGGKGWTGWTDVVAPTVTFTVTEAAAQPPIADRDLGAILFREQRLTAAQVMSLMERRSAPLGGFRLTSELLDRRASPGSGVGLTVTLRNLSAVDLSCWETSYESISDVDYIVEGPQGAVMPKPRSPHRVLDGRIITIPPGEAITHQFHIHRYYDFSMPGEYRITAVRRMPTPQGWAYLVSNTEVLTVEPPR